MTTGPNVCMLEQRIENKCAVQFLKLNHSAGAVSSSITASPQVFNMQLL